MKEVFWHPQIGFTMRHLLLDELFESLMDCSVTLCTLMQQCQANRSCKALTFRMEDFFSLLSLLAKDLSKTDESFESVFVNNGNSFSKAKKVP